VMVQEAHKIKTLEELKGRTLEELLHDPEQAAEAVRLLVESWHVWDAVRHAAFTL
jgi:hypothetical protein